MKNSLSLAPGVVVEPIGGEVLVVVPGGTDVIRLSHVAASIVLDLQAGKSVDPSSPIVAELQDLGVLATSGFSRRGLIKAGAIGAGAGIAVLAMPQAAMAASETLPAPILTNVNGTSGFGAAPSQGANFTLLGIIGARIDYDPDLDYEISLDDDTFYELAFSGGDLIVFVDLPDPAPGQATFTYFVRAKSGSLVSPSTQGTGEHPQPPPG